MAELTIKQLLFLLSELDQILTIIPCSDDEVTELEASYIPTTLTPGQRERDARFLEWFLQECMDIGVPSS